MPMSGRLGVTGRMRNGVFHFSQDGLRVAKLTIQKFVGHAARLYEQEREEPNGPSLLGVYVRRWISWVEGGLGGGLSGSNGGSFASCKAEPLRPKANMLSVPGSGMVATIRTPENA